MPITLTLDMSEVVTVTGTPTLTLNDGGTATYTGGSGTNALAFSYTVGAGDSTVSALAITGVNLPIGAAVKDGAGNVANLSGALIALTGLRRDRSTGAEFCQSPYRTFRLRTGKASQRGPCLRLLCQPVIRSPNTHSGTPEAAADTSC